MVRGDLDLQLDAIRARLDILEALSVSNGQAPEAAKAPRAPRAPRKLADLKPETLEPKQADQAKEPE